MPIEKDVAKSEWEARISLAAAHRLAVYYGWGAHIYNHIALRVPDQPDYYLIKPHRLLYDEVCASNLVKRRIDGTQAEGGERVNEAGLTIHTAILKARPEINCTMHFHGTAGMAISAYPDGLLPLSQGSMKFYNRLSFHEFEGIAVDLDETARLQRDLGPKNKAMILRNHGLLTCGVSVGETLTTSRYLADSCALQMMLLATGCKPLIPPPEVCEHTAQQYEKFESGSSSGDDWPAYLRVADNIDPSYRN